MSARIAIGLWPLFFGLSFIGLAVGVQGSLLGYRAELEGFADTLIGREHQRRIARCLAYRHAGQCVQGNRLAGSIRVYVRTG